MKPLRDVLVFAAALVAPALLNAAPSPFAGRWDITVTTPREMYPGWMELVERDGKPQIRVQPRAGTRYWPGTLPDAEAGTTESPVAAWHRSAGRRALPSRP